MQAEMKAVEKNKADAEARKGRGGCFSEHTHEGGQ